MGTRRYEVEVERTLYATVVIEVEDGEDPRELAAELPILPQESPPGYVVKVVSFEDEHEWTVENVELMEV